MSVEKVKRAISPAGTGKIVPIRLPAGEKYYDWHPTKEDLMGDSVPQTDLIAYLRDVLTWLYHQEDWFVASSISIYQDPYNPMESPTEPDVALFKGAVVSEAERGNLRSWKMYEPNRPAPAVVFELASKDTWSDDLRYKPAAYLRMGVKEYFAYDPNTPTLWRVNRKWPGIRLRGWEYVDGQKKELLRNERGWIWSEELQHWLVADKLYLRLVNRDEQMALTRAEAAEQREAAEREAKESVEAKLEAAQKARAELLTKLRKAGIDPDNL